MTEIAIQFRRAPHLVFRGQDLSSNTLVLNVQPDEGISISFHAKLPGPGNETENGDHGLQLSEGIRRRRAIAPMRR